MNPRLTALLLFSAAALIRPLSAAIKLPTIHWKDQSLRLIARGDCHARMIRLRNGDILCCHERAKQCRIIERDTMTMFANPAKLV